MYAVMDEVHDAVTDPSTGGSGAGRSVRRIEYDPMFVMGNLPDAVNDPDRNA